MSPKEARKRWNGVRLFDEFNRREKRWMISTKLGTKKWRVVFGDTARSVALSWASTNHHGGEVTLYVASVKAERHANGQPLCVHAITLVK